MRITVIGGGAWGTTLAGIYAQNGLPTRLFVREHSVEVDIAEKRENTWYLPGVKLSENLEVTSEPGKAVEDAEVFLWTVPTQFFRDALKRFQPHLPKKPLIVCANKGIELESLMTMSQVVEDAVGELKPRFAMLSGPSFALETAKGMPTAVALGCADKKTAAELQEAMSTPNFRVYTSPDVRGVELGGAVKNVIAIAAGVADGLGFGSNARAALITRGLAEMARLGKAMGARAETFQGLSGLGDLVLTCTGDLSRNRQVGLKLGKGMALMDILGDMKAVAEGVKTTESLHALGKKMGVELPITEHVYKVLYENEDPREAVVNLMGRELKAE